MTHSIFIVEVWEALWSLGEDKASRLDEFSLLFFLLLLDYYRGRGGGGGAGSF